MDNHEYMRVESRPPVQGCPKLMYNGPCGGGSGNVCEVTGGKCPWVEKYLENPDHYAFHTIILDEGFKVTGYRPKPRNPSTRLMEEIMRGGPILSYEYVAGSKPHPSRIEDDLKRLGEIFTAVNFVDTPLGLPHVDPAALGILAARLGVEPVVQVSCKDKSRLQLEALILALGLHGVGNMLAVTGDWPGLMGAEAPKPVFDLDSVRLVYMARIMVDLGRTPSGAKVRVPRTIHVGVAVNPYFKPPRLEALRLAKKRRAGAEFAETQPIFSYNVLSAFMETMRSIGVDTPLIASILVAGRAETLRMVEKYMGISVPQAYMDAVSRRGLRGAYDYAASLASRIMDLEGVVGIHVLTMGNVDAAINTAERIREVI